MRRNVVVAGLDHGSQPIPLATVVGDLLVTGGISGRDPVTGDIPADPGAEVRQVFANLVAVLDAAGATAGDVAKITVFVRDRDIRQHINPEWLALFPDPDSRPSRHTLQTELPAAMRIQLECMAVLSHS